MLYADHHMDSPDTTISLVTQSHPSSHHRRQESSRATVHRAVSCLLILSHDVGQPMGLRPSLPDQRSHRAASGCGYEPLPGSSLLWMTVSFLAAAFLSGIFAPGFSRVTKRPPMATACSGSSLSRLFRPLSQDSPFRTTLLVSCTRRHHLLALPRVFGFHRWMISLLA